MSVSAVSSSPILAAYTPPAHHPAKASRTAADSISLSGQAQLLAKDGVTQAKQSNETAVQKTNEKLYGMA